MSLNDILVCSIIKYFENSVTAGAYQMGSWLRFFCGVVYAVGLGRGEGGEGAGGLRSEI